MYSEEEIVIRYISVRLRILFLFVNVNIFAEKYKERCN